MNKLLVALVSTVFAAGAFAQVSAPAAPAAGMAPAPDTSAAAAHEKKPHKKKKHRDHRPKLQDKSSYGVGN